jgi:hypothetical protein
MKPTGGYEWMLCSCHLSRARCIIECGMRFHGNYKDIITIIRCESLGYTSSVWDEPSICIVNELWSGGELLPYRLRPHSSC